MMEKKVKQTENIKLLEKALTLLKYNKEILGYSCDRTFSNEHGENINLCIEFEIPDDLSIDSDSSLSINSDSKYSTTTSTSTNNGDKVYTSTVTPTSESTMSSGFCNKNEALKNNANYQALNTLSAPIQDVFVEIKVYVRSYVQNKKDEGILERLDIELNPFKATPKEIIKSVLPGIDYMKIMRDGIYFTREDFDAGKDYDKEQNWMACFPYEMDMSLVKIHGSTTIKDFKMSFVLDDITREC